MKSPNKDGVPISRRIVCAAPLLLAAAPRSVPPRLSDDVATFVRFGIHRASGQGERHTARWLTKRLLALGYEASIDPFPVETLVAPEGRITVARQSVALFPQWLPPADVLGKTINAPLVALETDMRAPSIRVLARPAKNSANWIPAFDALVKEAADKNALALIMAVDHPSEGLYVCNQHAHAPFPIPVGLCARDDLPRLASAARAQPKAQFRLDGKMVQTNALNVIARKAGVGPTLIVSTPLTGWFHCGGERGPGIALWLRMAAQLARQPRPVLLIGTGSHEIGHLGMEHALANGVAPKPADVALWLHFGASLGATRLDDRYAFKSVQALVGLPQTETLAKQMLSDHMPLYLTGNDKTLGEAGQVIGAGYDRFIGLSGFFPTFHTPEDRGEAIDYAKLEAISAASAKLLQAAPK